MTSVLEQAKEWIRRDPDPDTVAELQALVGAEDVDELSQRFEQRLAFGTAGIRGRMGAGPARMNRVVVRQVTAGLVARLRQDCPVGGIVIVGHDARHKSAEFAADAAAVLSAAGFDVRTFSGPVPTPLVAYATRELDAAAGVQITASHNPPQDNGYKLYWRGGAQIVAPLDAEISDAIDAADPVGDLEAAPPATPIGSDVMNGYRSAALALLHGGGKLDLRIVYTPLHGVAGDIVASLLEEAGFDHVHVVPEQAQPDGDFPTTDFPNPEVPGTLELAYGLAQQVNADLVLANDPDGDRIAVALPNSDGKYKMLTGDQVGCLLAEELLKDGLGGQGSGPKFVATTVVSSQLLRRIAEQRDATFVETLTGFKWLAAAVAKAVDAGLTPVVCYEQALGVMLGDVVRDKDGITAALVIADLAARLAGQGGGFHDVLDDLARRHGVHVTAGRSHRLDDTEFATAVIERLRTSPPAQVEGVAVQYVDDFVASVRRHTDGTADPIDVPTHPLVSLVLTDGTRLQVRPSGTEPLLKFYIEVVEDVVGDDLAAARSRAGQRLERTADAFVALALHG